ncbi:MAG: nucleoside-diphosphate-sugar epimerase [Gemmatimonadetes bacterium]|nr:nucleoside-diphosphate-sugar epimerase [Gemmatimonadota bacterium]
MTRRVLVTGGAGFIGSHTAERFLADGWAVDIVDNLATGKRENLPAGATFHELDITGPGAAELVSRTRPDVLVHLAAQMDVRKSVADPVFDAGTNIVGSLRLLEAVRHDSPATRVLFASTGGVIYGDQTTPPNAEEFAKNPDSPYAIAKLSVELYLAYYARIHGLDTVALRFGNVYGPRQDPHGEAGVVAIFCGRILDGQPLTIFGDGRQTRDYVFVSDVVDAVMRASTGTLPAAALVDTRAYNIGTGVGTPVLRIAEILKRAAGSNVPLEFAPHRPGEQQESFVDVTKAARELAWRPVVSLEDGLSRSYEWFAARHAAARPAGAR